jgi:hypothetical protein
MRIEFYLAEDGEVLSNKDHPVDKPRLYVPMMPGTRMGQEGPIADGYWAKEYKAVRIMVPNDAE